MTTVILKGVPLLIFFINIFNPLKGATKILLGVPPRSLFFSFDHDYRIRFSKEYAAYTYKVLNVEEQKLCSRYNTHQERVIIVRRVFTVLHRTLYQGDRRFTLE